MNSQGGLRNLLQPFRFRAGAAFYLGFSDVALRSRDLNTDEWDCTSYAEHFTKFV